MTPQTELARIKSLFFILNQRGHMIDALLAKRHVKDIIEILRSGNTPEFYEEVLNELNNEK